MKKYTAYSFLFIVLGICFSRAQISFIGFDQPFCGQPLSNVYTYTNYSYGSGSGYTAGFYLYKNSAQIYTEGGQPAFGGGQICKDIYFINDTIGFCTIKNLSPGGHVVKKTYDGGYNWTTIGSGGPNYLGTYVINKNFVYLVTEYFFVAISRCSDLIAPTGNFIFDGSVNQDIFKKDSTIFSSLCNIDSLRISVKNGNDTVVYHINFPCTNLSPLVLSASSTTFCTGQTATLSASGANTYSWSTGSTSSTIVVTPTVNTTYTLSGFYPNGCKNVALLTQSMSCVGISELNMGQPSLVIHPNPCHSNLNIQIDNTAKQNSIVLTDAIGKIVLEKRIKNGDNTMDVSGIAKGLYYCILYTENKISGVSKLMIE